MAINWVDLVVILLLMGAGYIASRIGLFRQLFVVLGFFGGMVVGGVLFPYFLPIDDKTLRMIINCNLVLIFAFYMGIKGYDLGDYLRRNVKRDKNQRVEQVLGVVMGSLATLIVVWLLAVVVGRLPFASLSNSANDAYSVQNLNKILPPVPAIFAGLDQLIDPNIEPHIFEGRQPKPQLVTSPLSVGLIKAAEQASKSTMRITGFGCGGIVSGSGFVVADELVATNAHVIAGVERPIIKDGGMSYEGTPVYFNANMDFAVMKVQGLKAKPIALEDKIIKDSTPIVVLGYPNGNFTAHEGVVRSQTSLVGTNIYNFGRIGREVYEIQAKVKSGNSGGPIIVANSKSAGIVFARDTSGVGGFSLLSTKLIPMVEQASKTNRRVSTGACLAS